MNDSGLLLEKSYQIPYELFRTAFTAFQKKFVYPRSYLTMALLGVIIGIYSYFVITTEEQRPLYCMIILVCLMLIGFQWYNPRKIRRNLMLAVKEIEQDSYRIRIYPEYLEIGTILPPEDTSQSTEISDSLFDDSPEENFSGTRIYYNKSLHMTEYDNFFMLYQSKTMFYVLPKAVFSPEELEILRVHFSQKLEKTFSQNMKKI